MEAHTFASLRRGIEAGLIASVPQVLIPHAEQRLLHMPPGSADIGPRFIERLAKLARRELPEDIKWLGASSFHFGYAALWGALYALALERRPVRPIVGGLLLSGVIYGITFTSWGGAVRSGTELPPEQRGWKQALLDLTAPVVYGLGTALLYGRGPGRLEDELALEILARYARRLHGTTV